MLLVDIEYVWYNKEGIVVISLVTELGSALAGDIGNIFR